MRRKGGSAVESAIGQQTLRLPKMSRNQIGPRDILFGCGWNILRALGISSS
jgi:hypothetical protein